LAHSLFRCSSDQIQESARRRLASSAAEYPAQRLLTGRCGVDVLNAVLVLAGKLGETDFTEQLVGSIRTTISHSVGNFGIVLLDNIQRSIKLQTDQWCYVRRLDILDPYH
jgi:hypothetical protein